jgi:probable HAF family extracellular repeat protein
MPRRRAAVRPRLEPFEDRCLLSDYVVTDLGSFVPNEINNLGQMVGASGLWQNGTTIDLLPSGGPIRFSNATDINEVGQVIGLYGIPDPNPAYDRHRAFLVTPEDTNLDGAPDQWYRDTNLDGVNDLMLDLGLLPGGIETYARSINNSGIVVGESYVYGPSSANHAWIWQNGVMTALNTFAGAISSSVSGINDAGQVVGYTNGPGGSGTFLIIPEDTDGDGTPDLWNRDANSDGANDLMVLLPDPFGADTGAGAHINAGGQVTYGNFLWTPDTPNGTTGSLTILNPNDQWPYDWVTTSAIDINDSGQVVVVVSYSDEIGNAYYHFLWENGELVDLNSLIPPTVNLLGASAINNQGWIVGSVPTDPYGYTWRGILLTPSDQPPPPIPPSITIGDMTLAEGNSGTRTANFTVTLSAASSQPVAVAYAAANGTAAAGTDYQATSGTLTIPAGQTTGIITVLVNGDRVGEANETFVVTLGNPTNATIADGQGMGTIVDDEPRISITDVTKAEGRRGQTTLFTFTVTLSMAYDQPVTMSFATANGSATTSNNDYVAQTGTLTFALGETTKTITIEVKGDSKKEGPEYFYLNLFGLSGNAMFTKSRGIGTILNDD